jgi:NADPH-dependent 2,4-dienoyl-CoA reductase/sulfur reductase-like enzyme
VVIGGGAGSAAAVAELRKQGFDGSLTLVSAENTVPYERPPLSKGFVLPGLDGDGACYLRTGEDAAALRDRMTAAGHVAVLGGGFIGCEVAAAAIRLGKRATILEALPTLLHRALGPELGDVAAQHLPGHGRRVRVEHHDTAIRHGRVAARNCWASASRSPTSTGSGPINTTTPSPAWGSSRDPMAPGSWSSAARSSSAASPRSAWTATACAR